MERNPVRAGMVNRARDYRWSSAEAHIVGQDQCGLRDMEWWHREGPAGWEQHLDQGNGVGNGVSLNGEGCSCRS